MADTKLSDLTAAGALAAGDLFYVVQSLSSRQATGTQMIEFIEDSVDGLLVGGTDISLTYNDAAGTLTIDFTGTVPANTDDLPEGTTNLYYTTARFDTAFATKDTDDLAEGATNLYYTTARFDTAFATKDTDDLAEGTTNLYVSSAQKTKLVDLPAITTIGTGLTLSAGTLSRDALTGDVTTSGNVATIANNAITTAKINDAAVTTGKVNDGAITNAKLANRASGTILGRVTAGTGDVEDLAAADVNSILGLTSRMYLLMDAKDAWTSFSSRAELPRSYTISSVSGQTITLSAAVAGSIFNQTRMAGNCYVRIENTTKSQFAWVEASPASNQITVRAADNITTWAASDTLVLGNTPTDLDASADRPRIPVDISPLIISEFGAEERLQAVMAATFLTGATGEVTMTFSNLPRNAGQLQTNAGTVIRSGSFTVPTTLDSPISDTNLLFIGEEDNVGSGSNLTVAIFRITGLIREPL